MLDCSYMPTPMAIQTQAQHNDSKLVDFTAYGSLVGALQYLTFTRLHIVHGVNKVPTLSSTN